MNSGYAVSSLGLGLETWRLVKITDKHYNILSMV